MKIIITYIYIGLLLCSTGAGAHNFEAIIDAERKGSNFEVKLYIQKTGTGDIKLGTSSFVINYNSSALKSPVLLPGEFDELFNTNGYMPQLLKLYGENGVGVETDVFTKDSVSAISVTHSKHLVATILFTIVNPAAQADLAWSEYSAIHNVSGADVSIEVNFTAPPEDIQALPVELISFKAVRIQENVRLNWQTASELNNDYFSILRSENGNEWKDIGQVKGNGTIHTVSYYEFMDLTATKEVNFYRLMQVDYDGKRSFSKIIRVPEVDDDRQITVWPVPARDGFISVSGINKPASIKIYNATGQVVMISQINPGEKKSVDHLKKGFYILEIESDGKINKQKIILD
jgi:hypothetical protein